MSQITDLYIEIDKLTALRDLSLEREAELRKERDDWQAVARDFASRRDELKQELDQVSGGSAVLRERLAEAEKRLSQIPEHPAGAIHNGRVAIERLENTYEFQEQKGHKLALCSDWQEVVCCFEYLASHAEQIAFLVSPGCAGAKKPE